MDNDRPSYQQLKNVYDRLFKSGSSLSELREATLWDKFLRCSDEGSWTAGRSLAWKLFLIEHEPLPTSSPRISVVLNSLRTSRKRYGDLMLERLRAPDGTYDSSAMPNTPFSEQQPSSAKDLEQNNPLSLHNDNPWNEWFASIEVRKTIMQDVERTFPGMLFFRDPEVQVQLANILFLYSGGNPSLGYRQGMHELLALLYLAVHYDSTWQKGQVPEEDEDLLELCSVSWVAADSWLLFEAMMNGISQWYEWQAPLPNSTSLPSGSSLRANIERQSNFQSYISPIVKVCNNIQATMLKACDPVLWKHMQTAGIEPQIYGIRWLRLLFTRELSIHDAMKMWDGLFACDPTLDIAQWVCVAMLIRIRNELLTADYNGQLTILLRYPSVSPGVLKSDQNHVLLLLRQALALHASPSTDTGKSVIYENHMALNKPLEAQVPIPASQGRAHPVRPNPTINLPAIRPLGNNVNSSRHVRQSSSSASGPGIPEMIARGLLERGENLGISKTLMSAVSELRRNIPDLTGSLSRNTSPAPAAFPLDDERLLMGRSPWESRSRFEVERDIRQFKTRDRRLGEALRWIVDVLLQDDGHIEDKQRLQNRKREALESLSYIRDVLLSNTVSLDDDRLLSEEELSRRKLSETSATGFAKGSFPSSVSLPTPMPVIDSQAKHSTSNLFVSTFPFAPSENTTSPPSPLPPWNYTNSSFSQGGRPPEGLPRPPPRTSTGVTNPLGSRVDQIRTMAVKRNEGRYQDPLGALR